MFRTRQSFRLHVLGLTNVVLCRDDFVSCVCLTVCVCIVFPDKESDLIRFLISDTH